MYRAKGITYHHENHSCLLFQCKVSLLPGAVTPLFGGTGVGKSTLLKILSGMISTPDGAELGLPFEDVALLHQFSEEMLFLPTIFEEWSFSLKQRGEKDDSVIEGKILSLAEALGLTREILFEDLRILSGGYRRLASLGSILVLDFRMLLFDEPTVGLDDFFGGLLFAYIEKRVRDDDLYCLLVTHDSSLFFDNEFSGYYLSNGDLISVTRDELIANDRYHDVLPVDVALAKSLFPVRSSHGDHEKTQIKYQDIVNIFMDLAT